MSSRYSTGTTTTTTQSGSNATNTGLSGTLTNQITEVGKAFEKSISLDTVVSIVIGGAITAVVWFFINRYLNEHFPEKKK